MQIISGKIPVRVQPFFWLLASLIGWINSATIVGTVIWIVVIVISVLVHEYGHALTAIAFGQRAKIELTGFGGLTKHNGVQINRWQEFLVVLNGPLAGLCLCGVAYSLFQMFQPADPANLFLYALYITYNVNLFWTLVNLLPIQPLDGGHLLRITLESMFGIQGLKISLFISTLFALLIGFAFFSINFILPGILFFFLLFENYASWRKVLHLSNQDQNTELQQNLRDAEYALKNGDEEAAWEKLQQVRSVAKKGALYVAATEHCAEMLSSQGEFVEAYRLFESLGSKLSPDGVHLFQYVAYHCGKWKKAVTLGQCFYQEHPNYDTAVLNALCHSLLGEVQPAIGWIQCAIRDGLPNLRETLMRSEFDEIRKTPQFQEFQREV